ncbi:MAG: hypothetical protein LR008_00050 [Candidatus Pacebacteria bacterium]|nr:hypothetical protein [Candidatus Paceibacterota bacterium]
MTTTKTKIKKLVVACLVTILATPLSGEVFAQSLESDSLQEVAVEATTTESTSISDVLAEPELWYRSERISGNIEVGDFVVGPGRSEIEIKPGETVVQEISVTNRIAPGKIFSIEVEDMTGSADGSSAVRLTGNERGPYSIRDYISFPEDSFELDLGERARIPVTITIPPDGEPGGYYGSVLISVIQDQEGQLDAGSVPRSPIIARVGSLFFVTVRGETVTEGETISLSLINDSMWYEKGPINMGILYENTGSVHVNPYGEISITNMFGEEVGFIELEPWFVLPKSLRVREIAWDREFLLGRYNAVAKINRGYEDVVDEVSVSFWVLPWKIVGGVFFVLFLIIFSIRAFFRTFEFKRK